MRYDARLVASCGEILSEEEQEKRELERQLQMRQAASSRRFDVARDGRTVRPGSQIYVQVTDFCRDLTDAPDTSRWICKTGLGDTLEGVELTETGPHTGVFRGAVPTGLPLPRATASDTDEPARSPRRSHRSARTAPATAGPASPTAARASGSKSTRWARTTSPRSSPKSRTWTR